MFDLHSECQGFDSLTLHQYIRVAKLENAVVSKATEKSSGFKSQHSYQYRSIVQWLERTPDKGEVAGSIPATPTKRRNTQAAEGSGLENR